MNIAVIGSGGREHALSWKLVQSDKAACVYTIPGNAGTENNESIDISDFAAIRKFCREKNIDLIFVGPEQPLTAGIVDFFADSQIMVFGPDKAAAQLEGSKVFAKEFMRKYKVATAEYRAFSSIEPARAYCNLLEGVCVIKYDGLAAGKGVFVCKSREDANIALEKIYYLYGKEANILVEELLLGEELSILAFTDGKNYQLLLPSQDHKQLLDGDRGPNTGGMGAFCPVDLCTSQVLHKIKMDIIDPTIEGINQENFSYHGVLYFGLMLTKQGPKVLEYNVRLGDPETEVVLPALKSDLLDLVLACYDGRLRDYALEFHHGYFVDIVLASGGYPEAYTTGYIINNSLEDRELIFHSGSKLCDGDIVTSGGRVLNIVAQGHTLAIAIENAYKKVEKVYFKDMYYRKDIGRRAINR
jgi:phosphoribosylamine---glycine ligase